MALLKSTFGSVQNAVNVRWTRNRKRYLINTSSSQVVQALGAVFVAFVVSVLFFYEGGPL